MTANSSFGPRRIWMKPFPRFAFAVTVAVALLVSLLTLLGAMFDATARRDAVIDTLFSQITRLNRTVAEQGERIEVLDSRVDMLTSLVDNQNEVILDLTALRNR